MVLVSRPNISKHHQPGEIPSEGDLDCPIAFIGQAPARTEEEQGRPFIGRAGNVLQQCLHASNLIRSDVYLTNLVKIRPYNDDIRPYFNKDVITLQGHYWMERLKEELQDVKANVLIPLGNEALLAMTNKTAITKWRGSILNSTLIPGRKVIPTIHPASVTYGNFIARYFIVEDIKRAITESKTPGINLPKRNYIIDPTFQEAKNFLESIKDAELISFDIECTGGMVTCISFAVTEFEAISIPVAHYSLTDEAAIWRVISSILGDPKIAKLGQNVIFDTQYLLRRYKIRTRGIVHDTMIANHILYPDFPKGLDFLVSLHGKGEPYYKDEGKQWRFSQIKDWPQFWTYNAKDAALTLAVWNELDMQIKEEGFRQCYDDTMAMLDPLNFMVYQGIAVDTPALMTTKERVEKELKETQAELDEEVGEPLNVNSSKQCMAYFYTKLGIDPFTRYNKLKRESRPTIDDKALQSLAKGSQARPPIKAAKLVQRVRSNRKLLSTYLEIEFDKDNRFRCSYNMRGTTTGRLSSSKTIDGTGMNHQNLPKSFRGFLIPDEGQVFIDFDKRQAEWVVVAYVSGDANMIKIIETKKDAHAISGCLISRLPEAYVKLENSDAYVGGIKDPEEIEEKRKKLDFEHPHFSREKLRKEYPNAFWPRNYSIRAVGKHSNHGFNYDMTAYRFAEEYETTLDEAKIIETRYHEAYPAIRKWYKEIQAQLKENRTLENCFKRKRRFYSEWTDDLFKSAYDFIPQSTVVDLLNRGMIRIYHDRQAHMKPMQLLLQAHDGLLNQYPDNNIVQMGQAIWQSIQHLTEPLEYRGRQFTIATDVKIGYDWKNGVELEEVETLRDLTMMLPGALAKAKELHLAA